MIDQSELDELANLWNKTKDPKYKKLWYKLIEEMHGTDNFKRRSVSTNSSNKTNDGWNRVIDKRTLDCFDFCDILRLKLTGYVDTLNLHIMEDGSGNFGRLYV